MKPHDRDEFAALVAAAMAYYKQETTPYLLEVWWQGCQPFALEQVSKALTAHATDPDKGQFAPKVADMVRLLDGTKTDRSQLAWGKAFAAMSDVGAYQDVVFDDPAIHAAITDIGGWQKACRTETKELGYLQHRFCESYRAYASRTGYDYPRVLAGDRSPDEIWAKKGLPPPKPVVVGDIEKARVVYANGGGAAKSIAKRMGPLLGGAAA